MNVSICTGTYHTSFLPSTFAFFVATVAFGVVSVALDNVRLRFIAALGGIFNFIIVLTFDLDLKTRLGVIGVSVSLSNGVAEPDATRVGVPELRRSSSSSESCIYMNSRAADIM